METVLNQLRPAAELAAPDAPAAEYAEPAHQNVFARLGGTIRNGYDALTDRLNNLSERATALIAIGGIAFVGAQAAELALNSAPATADTGNTPTRLAEAFDLGATASDTDTTAPTTGTPTTSPNAAVEQECASVALARPEIVNKPVMSHAGIRAGQILRAGFNYPSLEDLPDGSGGAIDCGPEYFRVSYIWQEMKEDGEWVKVGPFDLTGAWGNQEEHAHLVYAPSHPRPENVYSECLYGNFQPNRIVINNYLKGGEGGQRTIDAHSRYIMNTQVNGNCQAAVNSRRKAEKLLAQ